MEKIYTRYKTALLSILLLCSSISKAQVSAYTFTQSSATYTALGSGGTRQTSAEGDEGGIAVTLPFTFNYNGIGYTSIAASTNGFIQMGTAVTNGAGAAYVSFSNSNGQIISSSTAGTFNTIAALNYDLNSITAISTNVTGTKSNGSNILTACSGSNFTALKVRPGMGITAATGIAAGTYITAVNVGAGTITLSANATNNGAGVALTISSGLVTATTGSSPNRIFTVQWSGRTRYNVVDDMDFQIKLYETTNVIEAYYNTVIVGTAASAGTNDLAQVGLKGAANTDFNNRSTTSNWAGTTAGGANTATCTLSAAVKPVTGQLYQWTPPPCMASVPSALTSSSVNTTTASISWTAASPAPANGYEYYWNNTGTAPTSGTTATGSTAAGVVSAGLTSLTPGSVYYFWVRGNCGAGKSGWIGSGTFTTPCVSAPLPYSQGFNATTIPSCWSQQFVTGTSPVQYVASGTNPVTTPQEGADYVLWNSFSTTSGNQTRLVSAPITTTGSATVNAKFYWFHDNSAYTTAGYADEGVKLQYSLNGTTWTDVQTINRLLTGTNGWTPYDITLPAGAGNAATMYVGFLFTSRLGDNCGLDNLLVYAPAPCTAPTDQPAALNLTNVNATSLSGAFNNASPVPSGYVVFRSTSSANPSLTNGTNYTTGSAYSFSGNNYLVVSNGTATSFTESSLTANTQYYYYAFSYNSSCIGAPYYLNVSPLTADVLTCTDQTASLTGVAASTTSANISFTAIPGAVSYILQYSIAGSGNWITAAPAPTASPYSLTGLTPGITYDIRLRGPNANCGTNKKTATAFTTPCSSFSLPVSEGFESGTSIPACWTQLYVSGTKNFSYGSAATAAGTSPNPAAATGSNRLLFPSYSTSGNQTRFYSPVIVTTGTSSIDVQFQWYFSSTGGSGSYTTEGVQVQWSTNGTTWTNAGSLIRRYGAADGWQKQILTLPAGAGNQPVLYVGFLFTANAGYDSYVDDILVRATPPCNFGGTASAASNSICGGSGSTTLTATDYSVSGAGLSYQWEVSTDSLNFSNLAGQTNPATAPTGTISTTRFYRLRVFCTSLGNAYSNIIKVTVGSYSIATTTPASRCGIGTVTLGATASAGSSISWYTVAVGGSTVGAGTSFTTPSISATTNYYVGANNGATTATIGATYSGTLDNATSTGSHGIVINTTSPNIVILSAKIPFTGKGTFTIQLQTTAGALVSSVITDTVVGGGNVPVTVPINMAISTPGSYRLLVTSITGTIDALGYISSATFPYTGLGGAFSVTAGYWYGNTSSSNMYLFNLLVSNTCESTRSLVTATVTAPPALTISPAAATICSGGSTSISVTSTASNFTTYNWAPVTGTTPSGTPSGMIVTLNPTVNTNYTLTATSASGCVNKVSSFITVNPAPPVTTSAGICSGGAATLTSSSTCSNLAFTGNAIAGAWNATTDPVAIQPVIFLPNSTTCEFDPDGHTMNYTTTTFQVSVTGSYNFLMDNNTLDGMGYIVTGAFVPGVCPGSGTWIVGDDDSGPGLMPMMDANLTAGVTYTLITTVFNYASGTATGSYNWAITPPSGGQIATGTTGTLQWYTVPVAGSSIATGSPFNPIGAAGSGIANNTSVGSYNFYAACSNNNTCRTLATFVIGTSGQWIGGTSTDWSNPVNWCGGVPIITTDGTIISGAPNMPVLSSGTGTVRNLTLNTGATLAVNNATMQIAGTITATNSITASAGTIELAGSTAQAISGSSFINRTLQNLKASNSVNVSSTANDSIKITGALSFGNVDSKVFNSGDNVILVSNATGTARVADITNNGANNSNSFTGKFVVQRYIPARRAWRLMTTPVTAGAQTINQAWQEGVGGSWSSNPKPGYGTHVTGGPARTTGQGFDQGPLNPSIYGYSGTAWNYLPATTGELATSREGWMLFIRGSRAINLPLSTTSTVADVTTLRPTGAIKYGTQPTITNAAGGFTVIGNPYPCPVNFKTIAKSGVIGGVGGNAYYLWDPNLGGTNGVGAFVTFSFNSGGTYDKSIVTGTGSSSIANTGVIPSSAAFMVNLNAGGSIAIAEKDKDTLIYSQSYVFRPAGNTASLRASLYQFDTDGSKGIADGNLVTFSEASSTAVDNEDALKINNFKENFAIERGSSKIAIERRNLLAVKDTIFYSMWNMKPKNYALEIATNDLNFPLGTVAFLEDTYLHQKTALGYADTTTVGFTVTTDAASSTANRFIIVIEPSGVVPVTFTNIRAYEQNHNIVVEWSVENELDIDVYEVEKSTDGIHFSSIGNTIASGVSNTYNWLDENAVTGDNFYRIKSRDNTGRIKYTHIVKVIISKGKPSISVYPNPVRDAVVNINFTNMPAGLYNIKISNAIGQHILTTQVTNAGSSSSQIIRFARKPAKGVYQLEVNSSDGAKQIFRVIVE